MMENFDARLESIYHDRRIGGQIFKGNNLLYLDKKEFLEKLYEKIIDQNLLNHLVLDYFLWNDMKTEAEEFCRESGMDMKETQFYKWKELEE